MLTRTESYHTTLRHTTPMTITYIQGWACIKYIICVYYTVLYLCIIRSVSYVLYVLKKFEYKHNITLIKYFSIMRYFV